MATANTTITLAEYLTMLESHDWYYSYSDDATVSRAGRASYAQLTAIAESSEVMTALFRAFCDHIHQAADKPSIETLQAEAEDILALVKQTNPKAFIKQTTPAVGASA